MKMLHDSWFDACLHQWVLADKSLRIATIRSECLLASWCFWGALL